MLFRSPLFPWDFPGKSTGVGCHFLLQGPRDQTQVFRIAGWSALYIICALLAGGGVTELGVTLTLAHCSLCLLGSSTRYGNSPHRKGSPERAGILMPWQLAGHTSCISSLAPGASWKPKFPHDFPPLSFQASSLTKPSALTSFQSHTVPAAPAPTSTHYLMDMPRGLFSQLR